MYAVSRDESRAAMMSRTVRVHRMEVMPDGDCSRLSGVQLAITAYTLVMAAF
jgi:hypothetical protein